MGSLLTRVLSYAVHTLRLLLAVVHSLRNHCRPEFLATVLSFMQAGGSNVFASVAYMAQLNLVASRGSNAFASVACIAQLDLDASLGRTTFTSVACDLFR